MEDLSPGSFIAHCGLWRGKGSWDMECMKRYPPSASILKAYKQWLALSKFTPVRGTRRGMDVDTLKNTRRLLDM